MKAAKQIKVRMVCSTCGSDDVLCDAYATWNYHDQEWELSNCFDKGAYCNKCDGETRIEVEEED